MTIGERIKKIRLEKGMTQKELAEKCGLFDSAIRRYESGRQNPKIGTVEKIANALGVNPMLLVYGEELSQTLKSINEVEEAINRNKRIFAREPNGEDMQYIINSNNRTKLKQDTIAKYDSLNTLGQQKANEYITDLSEQEKYTKPDNED